MTHATESRRLIELIERIARQDRQALTELHDHTAARLYGLALMLVATPPWAEQVLQDCYVSIWQRAREYRREHAPALDWIALRLRECAQHLLQGRAGRQALRARSFEQLLGPPGGQA